METPESFALPQIFIVSIALSIGKLKTFIEFEVNRPYVYWLKETKMTYVKRILFMHITFSVVYNGFLKVFYEEDKCFGLEISHNKYNFLPHGDTFIIL